MGGVGGGGSRVEEKNEGAEQEKVPSVFYLQALLTDEVRDE